MQDKYTVLVSSNDKLNFKKADQECSKRQTG